MNDSGISTLRRSRSSGCEQMVRRMPQIDHVEQLCNTYMVTKLKRRPFPRQAVYRMQK
jgi:hypothetical protein